MGVCLTLEKLIRVTEDSPLCFRPLAPPLLDRLHVVWKKYQVFSQAARYFLSLIEACSNEPYIELFARGDREGWDMWGNQASADYEPDWGTYANHTRATLSTKPPQPVSEKVISFHTWRRSRRP